MTASPPPTSDVDSHIKDLVNPSGDRRYNHVRDEALTWLLAHAAAAYPRVLALVEAGSPPIQLLIALPHFNRPESIPALEQLLKTAADATTVIAAQSLARHPQPEARLALERALADPRDQVVASAADALALRGDRLACKTLSSALSHTNTEVKERIWAAMQKIGCEGR